MKDPFEQLLDLVSDIEVFSRELGRYLFKYLTLSFIRFEKGKGLFVETLYQKRGKYARRFMHSSMAGLAALGIAIAPVVAQEFPGRNINPWEASSGPSVLSASTETSATTTIYSEKEYRDQVIKYKVQKGDTVSSIAEKFGVSSDTLRWQNDLKNDKISINSEIEILPVTGVSHVVRKGDTVYSIAKKYDTDPQAVVNFPYNIFMNDETFELAIGQVIIVPDGVMPAEKPVAPRIKQITPDAGTVVASGNFVWPTGGRISQRFVWYHKGVDIANKDAPGILAADAGTIISAGWPDGNGYGMRVVIDHGNGYKTLYAHLSKVYVNIGTRVNRGDLVGKMGSTGRSTGIHLHFEVLKDGVNLNPLSVLK